MSSPDTIRLLAVDDHPLIRNGIVQLLEQQPDLELVGEAASGEEAVLQHRLLKPDVTLMDLQMSDMHGIDAVMAIRAESPQSKIIVLTTFAGDVLAQRALKAGARAYLLKSAARKLLLETIRAVHAGQRRIEPQVAESLAGHTGSPMLTTRELEVLKLIAVGNSNRRVGAHLAINEETVKGYVSNILNKLDARDRTHAVTIGLRRGVLQL
jgi:DNA-binding NarL/FixJ family response regulator